MSRRSNRLTLAERAAAYVLIYESTSRRASCPIVVEEQGQPVLYAQWVVGANYRPASGYYGAFPPGQLEQIRALFPDIADGDVLHAFAGAVPAGAWTRCDRNPDLGCELTCRVEDLPRVARRRWALVVADPPYSEAHAARYGVPMIDRRLCLLALASVVRPGGFVAWLDTHTPIYRKELWRLCMRLPVWPGTNRALRAWMVFERRGR